MTHILRRNMIIVAIALSVLMVCGGCATTRPIGLADIGAEGCQAEIETYCKDVTMREARILACLYAHEDKLSERCKYTLYEASCQLARAAHE
jgi:Cysteine rich repeat